VTAALITALEVELRCQGFVRINAVHMTGKPGIEAVERMFAKCRWGAPVMRAITVRFTPAGTATAPWFGLEPGRTTDTGSIRYPAWVCGIVALLSGGRSPIGCRQRASASSVGREASPGC
jgi:hypothetical protein